MSTIRKTIDIEAGLQALLVADKWTACAPPLPPTLGASLPLVAIYRTGGTRSLFVQDEHAVTFDVYAADEAAAMSSACTLTAWATALEGQSIGDEPCHRVEIGALPYNNPDPRHPTLARASFSARIRTRTSHNSD